MPHILYNRIDKSVKSSFLAIVRRMVNWIPYGWFIQWYASFEKLDKILKNENVHGTFAPP